MEKKASKASLSQSASLLPFCDARQATDECWLLTEVTILSIALDRRKCPGIGPAQCRRQQMKERQLSALAARPTDGHDEGALLPNGFTLTECQVLAEAAVRSPTGERLTLVVCGLSGPRRKDWQSSRSAELIHQSFAADNTVVYLPRVSCQNRPFVSRRDIGTPMTGIRQRLRHAQRQYFGWRPDAALAFRYCSSTANFPHWAAICEANLNHGRVILCE